MLNRTNKHRSGFTIIEIMIVLAIAGLIMLIVFLAVPALQRSAANTSRKDDAGRLSSAVNDFVSNNNGNLPNSSGSSWSGAGGDCAWIINDAGSLSQYSSGNIACGSNSSTFGANSKFDWASGGGTLNTVTQDALVLDVSATCPTSANSAPTTTGGSTRQAALLYSIEPSSGNWTWDCIQSE